METYLKKKKWIVSACSSPGILLSGKQGSMLALAYLLVRYCIMRLEGVQNKFSKLDPLCVVQWSVLSTCFFFSFSSD
ncbi:unnamed protein product, partial [Brassica rapa subsp. trilocularis]